MTFNDLFINNDFVFTFKGGGKSALCRKTGFNTYMTIHDGEVNSIIRQTAEVLLHSQIESQVCTCHGYLICGEKVTVENEI